VIFVVDDDPRIRAATAAALRDMGHDVTEFGGGSAALEAMAIGAPDVLVTDVLMPDMTGTELAARAEAAFGVSKILFISGDVGDTPLSDFGAHELLSKPFTAQALQQALLRTQLS
jgi:CheY-like chemotaxis protein